MTSPKLLKIGKQTALFSFIIGTVVFLLYLITLNSNYLFLGYFLFILIFLCNLAVFVSISIKAKKDPIYRKSFVKVMTLMLLNIPILFVYLWIIFNTLNSVKVNFINNTGSQITDIHISGCEEKHMADMETGTSEKICISIPNDCAITVTYMENGQIKTETVLSYATTGLTMNITHEFGNEVEQSY